ncbi:MULTISPECIES: hypothetical protein [unclassified Tatumella]|uniref:hypothetical protein n=1 Tax=unclassified Tatumella TaxID=2649542 RepID=UPI001BAEAD92|nr:MULTISPECIES: hypothetical protein [unclassified Tatumella]MBS0878671.1 hypothetical protein [Tatumella sp. JGM82]MBS0892165.1 hypothetical protein [Tatumella sp. JGM94]MBS0903264.1 hypothetical protein [Tatumella sp. JGM100]
MSLSITLFRRRKFYLLLILMIIASLWLWPKTVPPDTMHYYRSLLCAVASGPEQVTADNFTRVLEKTVEGSNSDYSLRKYHYNSTAGNAVVKEWNRLSADQQQQARTTSQRCLILLQSVQ